ncbi:MAG: sugar ABC transporter permease [Alicyclobacillus sp.]|nr:sugar ABC transporter permease [Alicyclobacillus sp.]
MRSPAEKRNRYGYAFIVPYFIVFLIFGLYPILYSLEISFTHDDGFNPPTWVGLQNYTRLLHDQYFYQSIVHTLTIWIISIIPQITLALVLAIILNDKVIRGRRFFQAVFYLPNIVTPVTIGVMASLMFDYQTGFVNKLLLALHLVRSPIYWLGHPFLSQLIVGLIMCWQWFGYNMLIFIAGLQSIPYEVYEAAQMDGASRFRTSVHITLPLLRPVVLFTAITSIIGGMQIFDVPMMLHAVGDATQTMVKYLYQTGFVRFDYGYAAAMAYGIFVLIVVFSVLSIVLNIRGSRRQEVPR